MQPTSQRLCTCHVRPNEIGPPLTTLVSSIYVAQQFQALLIGPNLSRKPYKDRLHPSVFPNNSRPIMSIPSEIGNCLIWRSDTFQSINSFKTLQERWVLPSASKDLFLTGPYHRPTLQAFSLCCVKRAYQRLSNLDLYWRYKSSLYQAAMQSILSERKLAMPKHAATRPTYTIRAQKQIINTRCSHQQVACSGFQIYEGFAPSHTSRHLIIVIQTKY